MIETPESLVYRKAEGTGYAQVFGREGNPMKVFKERKAEVERRQALEVEKAKLAREKRDKDLWALINVDPNAAYEPFDRQIKSMADKHRQNIVSRIEATGGAVTDDLRLYAKKGWDEINTHAAKSQYIKKVLDETRGTIEKSPYLNYEYYFPKLNELYMNPDGSARDLDDINVEQIKGIYVNDPLGFNDKKYTEEFVKGLNTNMTNYITQTAQNNGILTEDHETKWKGNLYTKDENSPLGVAVDAQGKPIINVTQDLVNSMTSSPAAKRYFEAVAQQNNTTVEEVIREKIAPRAGLEQNVRATFTKNSNAYNIPNQFGLKPHEVQQATDRAVKLKSLVNAIGPDGSVTPEARSAAGMFRNAKFGDGHILEATVVPGNNTPGTSEPFEGVVVTNSPHPRMVFKVKYSDRGWPKAEVVELDNEGAFETLNGLLESSPSEGKQSFSTYQLTGLMGWQTSDIYKENKGKGVATAAAAEQEKATVDRILNAEVDKPIPELAGHYFNGMKITGAQRVVSDPGLKVPFTNWNITDDKTEIELELTGPDGKKTYQTINGYEEVAKVLRGEGSPQSKLKSTYKANGKSYSIDELRKNYTDAEIEEAVKRGLLQ